MQVWSRPWLGWMAAGAAMGALTLVAGASWRGLGTAQHQVSQRGRAFQPGELAIQRGDTVRIVNDDADLLHHAYVESDAFAFDSGNIDPGAKADVTFPVAGTFNVLCGVHPKMKLVVQVR